MGGEGCLREAGPRHGGPRLSVGAGQGPPEAGAAPWGTRRGLRGGERTCVCGMRGWGWVRLPGGWGGVGVCV